MKDNRARAFRGQAGCHISRLDQSQVCCQPNGQHGQDSDR